MRHSWLRFGVEFLFIVGVAVIAGIANLRPVAIILVMAVAWILVAAYEWTASRQPIAATGGAEPLAEDGPGPEAGVVRAERRPFWQRAAKSPPPAPEPAAPAPEDDSALQHVRVLPREGAEAISAAAEPVELLPGSGPPPEQPVVRPLAQPVPSAQAPPEAPAPTPAVTPVPAAEPVLEEPAPLPPPVTPVAPVTPIPAPDQPAPAAPEPAPAAVPPTAPPEPAQPAPPPELVSVPPLAPEPVVPPAPAPEPERVVQMPPPSGPREWNIWELERLARADAGKDTYRDEERSFLLMYLREFASAEGLLPLDFDGVVRDSFGDLVGAQR